MTETSTNSAYSFKSLSDLMNNTSKSLNTTSELLNGLRSESGWNRLQTVSKIIAMCMGGGA